ncbi:hypothetical protein AgCh_021297 [Apium graveolens]
MDFVTGLPNSHGYSVIFVVVDRLSKFAHFMPLKHPFDAVQVAQVYLDNVFKLHGWPKSIVSDRDSIFLSKFWQSLFSIHGTVFKMSTAYHPATDGQTEVITPYEVVFNQPPPLHLPYLAGETANQEVDISLLRREQMISVLKLHLTSAQNRMKVQTDKHRTEREFQVGDWVWLKVQDYKQITLQQRSNQKLASKFCGPFQILARIGTVAYKLRFSPDIKIHDVVHISKLKKFHGDPPVFSSVPQWLTHESSTTGSLVPEAILDHRMVKFQNSAQIQYLVQWQHAAPTENSWELAADFADQYPELEWEEGFELEDEEEVAAGEEVLGSGIVVYDAKRVLVGAGARALFYPTLLYNVVRNRLQTEFRWWDPIDEAHDIDHLVLPTRDYLFAPSFIDLSQAVGFIHEQQQSFSILKPGSGFLLGNFVACLNQKRTTYVHCKAGRGRSTTVVICYLVQHKEMTPDDAYYYVKSIRPRVLLAPAQLQAVHEYYNLKVKKLSNSSYKKICKLNYRIGKELIPRMFFKTADLFTFDDGSLVLITSADLDGYEPNREASDAERKIWGDLSVVYRVQHVSRAALTRFSCLWLRYKSIQTL